jgi:hypothetical protein
MDDATAFNGLESPNDHAIRIAAPVGGWPWKLKSDRWREPSPIHHRDISATTKLRALEGAMLRSTALYCHDMAPTRRLLLRHRIELLRD